MGFVWRAGSSELGEQTVGSEWERTGGLRSWALGEREWGKMGRAWLIAGWSECP